MSYQELESLEQIHTLEKLKYSLFGKRRFLPIFLATFLGAFNDNLLRSGLVVLIAYSASFGIALPIRPEILVTLCSALLVIPMLFFSSLAGTVADKYEKSRLVRIAKIAELLIMFCVWYGFSSHHIPLLMVMLFVSGMHTTFYSPIKFSILPDHLSQRELLAGNGFMAGGSYLAILLGLITGGLLVKLPHNVIGETALAIACIGFAASLFIPPSRIAHAELRINFNLWQASKDIVAYALQDKIIIGSITGLSWFLLVGSVFMSQFANYAQSVVHADNGVYILFLTVFSIGIAAGSLVCDTLLKGEISLKLTPFVAFGVSLFTCLMVILTPRHAYDGLYNVSEFLAMPQHWLVLVCILMVAVCGGIYLVPLYAMLQSHTPAQYRSRVMAASNLSDSIFMTVAALASALLLSLGFAVTDLFMLLAALNLTVVYYARQFTA
jgi:acyl-[acyl-carrier-protein]-phospholipid O-acyltransferase/long-chain-fatty-acid--[acyl-carrier-protein] ligase